MSDQRASMAEVGLTVYKENFKNLTSDTSVLVASYMKSQLDLIEGGLIPAPIRALLIQLLKDIKVYDPIPSHITKAVYTLLSFHSDRLETLRVIAKVATTILAKGTISPIPPIALARIIKVSGSEAYDDVCKQALENKLDLKAVHAKIDEWNTVWGLILTNSDLFLQQEQLEHSAQSKYTKLKQ